MKKITIISLMLIFTATIFSGCSNQSADGKTYYFDKDGNVSTAKLEETKKETAEKLEIYYFHRTARCYSCNTMSDFMNNLISKNYGQQVKEGKIDFKQVNVELPENKEIAMKFQASGSSLFINRIINGSDNIEQDANVWRYLGSELNFNKYLEDKIDSYLGL